MWFIGGEVEQETNAPPPKTNPGSASATGFHLKFFRVFSKNIQAGKLHCTMFHLKR